MKIPAILILLVMIQPACALAQTTPQGPLVPSIEVTGNGEARANPDRATMDIAVETQPPLQPRPPPKMPSLRKKSPPHSRSSWATVARSKLVRTT